MAMDEEAKLRREVARGAGVETVRRLLALLENKGWEPVPSPPSSALASELAAAFSEDLSYHLAPKELAVVVERNRREEDDGICHSHDFIDANECMDAAFRKVRGRRIVVDDEWDNALWNEAWRLAMDAEFDPGRVGWRRRLSARGRKRNPRDRRRLERAAARGDAAAKARLEAEEDARVAAALARHGISEADVESVLDGYLRAILFAENDNEDPETGGDRLDRNYCSDDFDEVFVAKARRTCRRFVAENARDLLDTLDLAPRGEWSAWDHHGHDLWLTTRGHGVGFWDRGYGAAGRRLEEACKRKPYADAEHYVTFVQDGKVYVE